MSGGKELMVDFDEAFPGTAEEQAAVRAALDSGPTRDQCVWVTLARMPDGWRVVLARMIEGEFVRLAGLVGSPTRDEGHDCTPWAIVMLGRAGIAVEQRQRG